MDPTDDRSPVTWADRVLRVPGCALLMTLAIVLLAHLPGLANGFVWDDGPLIGSLDRPDAARVLTGPLLEGVRPGETTAALDYVRPLVGLSLALDLRLQGRSASALHGTNLGLHLLALALLWSLLGRLGAERSVTVVAVLLAGLHPLVTQPVFWISARGDLLCTTAALAALVAWCDARATGSRAWLAAALVAVAAAVAAKESAAWLLLGLVLVETAGPGAAASGRRARLSALAMTSAVVAWLRVAVVEGGAGPQVAGPASLPALAGTVATTLTTYLRWLVVPVHIPLEVDASTLPLRSLTLAHTPFLVVAIAVVGGAVTLVRRPSLSPAPRLLPLLALASLAPVANLVMLSPPLAPRHAYALALLGTGALAAWLCPLLRGTRLLVPATATLALLFASATWRTAPVYFTDVTLFKRLVAEQPQGSFARTALARALVRDGATKDAEAVLEPLVTRPGDGRGVRLLARLLETRGECLRAESLLRHELAAATDAASTVALVQFLIRQRRFEAAEAALVALPRAVGEHPSVQAALVSLAAAAGDATGVVARARGFVALHPHDARSRRVERLMAAALGAQGRHGEARTMLLRTWAASGGSLTDTRMLAELAAAEGNVRGAVELLDDVTPRRPSSPEELRCAMALASLLARAGRMEGALERYQEAVAAGFDLAPVRAGEILLLLTLGRPAAAQRALVKLVELRPADLRSRQALATVTAALRTRDSSPVDGAGLVARIRPLLPGSDEAPDEEAP